MCSRYVETTRRLGIFIYVKKYGVLMSRSKFFIVFSAVAALLPSSATALTAEQVQITECFNKKSLSHCVALLQSPKPKLREDAVSQMGRLDRPSKDALPYLFRSFNDPNPYVRRSAAFSFANIIEPRDSYVKPAIPKLVSMLKDSTPEVRAGASCALARIGKSSATKGVLKYIIPLLSDPKTMTRGAVAGCLIDMGEYAREAAPYVMPLLDDPNIYTQAAAHGMLTKLGYKVETKSQRKR
jgi:HEAT repeat protein